MSDGVARSREREGLLLRTAAAGSPSRQSGPAIDNTQPDICCVGILTRAL